MNQRTKKTISILILICVVFFIVFLIFYAIHGIQGLKNAYWSFKINDFHAYEMHLNRLAQKALELYDQEVRCNPELSSVNLVRYGENFIITYYSASEKYTSSVKMSQQEKDDWEYAVKAMSSNGHEYKQGLASIEASQDQVTFHTGTVHTLIYMRYGNRPYSFNKSYYVDRIGIKWFEVMYIVN